MIKINEIIQGEVVDIAFGGYGIIKKEGFVIFIPFTAPGDLVNCRINEVKKNHAFAEILNLIKKSPQRITPPCPFFGRCGGCQLQHLTYDSQLEYKKKCIEEALRRIGKLSFTEVKPVRPSLQQWAYRRHINLTIKPVQGSFTIGYIQYDHFSFLPINQCPIFEKGDHRLFQTLINNLKLFECKQKNYGKLMILKEQKDRYLLQFNFKFFPSNSVDVLDKFMENKLVQGALLNSPGHHLTKGDTWTTLNIDDLHFFYSPKVFIQNHPEQSLNIYRELCHIINQSQANKILDLYCGIGIVTLMLAKLGKEIVGVESNHEAIQFAKKNAEVNRLKSATFIHGMAHQLTKNLIEKLAPQLVIVNPPRTGLDRQTLNQLLEGYPREILYLSCMPATLARDLQSLCNKGYQINTIQPFDMFPQTGHVETLVHLYRNTFKNTN